MKLKTKKYYKDLYETAKSNQDKLIEQCSKIGAENVNYQKQIKKLKEQNTQLTFDNEDLAKFLVQEKECNKELRKERTKLRKKITKLGGEWKDGE